MTKTARMAVRGEFADRRDQLANTLRERGLAAAVIADARDIEYLTGADPVTELGPNPFAGSISTALVLTQEGEAMLVGPEPDVTLAMRAKTDVTVHTYDTFEDLSALRPRCRLSAAVLYALTDLRVAASTPGVGIESSSVPAGLMECMAERFPHARLHDVEDAMARQRSIKSPAELELLRAAIVTCDHAQTAAADAVEARASLGEIEATIRGSIGEHTGIVPALVEVSTRSPIASAEVPLPGDCAVLTDIAPRVDGYWGDSCNTYLIGTAGKPRKVVTDVLGALRSGLNAIRPGALACDVDAAMRHQLAESRSPAYTGAGGHGIGLDYHETPRLTPHDRTRLQPGMILAIEPGVYSDDLAVRLEVVVRVVLGGCEVLSRHFDLESPSAARHQS
jgi:Xaa-Pro dipeptidase